MDTVVTIRSYDLDTVSEKNVDRAFTAAFAKIRSVERHLSIYDKNSETVKINRRAGTTATIKVSPDMWDAIKVSKKIAALTRGGFDPTIGPLTDLWRFGNQPRVPKKAELRAALRLVGSKDIVLDGPAHSVRLRRKGMRLDLGGIAKG
ncbi:MAG TPA: FAD:protein FMN transferase, partial [Actinobacteria bacterium]|nr:FAD:protein FMN transferase [Actinomycetota bacterium]